MRTKTSEGWKYLCQPMELTPLYGLHDKFILYLVYLREVIYIYTHTHTFTYKLAPTHWHRDTHKHTHTNTQTDLQDLISLTLWNFGKIFQALVLNCFVDFLYLASAVTSITQGPTHAYLFHMPLSGFSLLRSVLLLTTTLASRPLEVLQFLWDHKGSDTLPFRPSYHFRITTLLTYVYFLVRLRGVALKICTEFSTFTLSQSQPNSNTFAILITPHYPLSRNQACRLWLSSRIF